jgi:hypothetical protein
MRASYVQTKAARSGHEYRFRESICRTLGPGDLHCLRIDKLLRSQAEGESENEDSHDSIG